ncbi:MAG: PASTA domain-containing protein [Anaerolineae bacterium]|nr:PASTA domain-containing protein [Anaerolineae bacterium]
MHILKNLVCLLALIGLLVMAAPVLLAQEGGGTPVPDVTGLHVPAAAARLNEVGLVLGSQTDEPWTEAAGQPANTILTQTVPPGQTVDAGSAVGVTVLRSPNMLLLYDVEGITLINQSGADLDLNGLVFTALDGATASSFPATNWLPGLAAGECTQLWAVRRTGPSRLGECAGIARWLSTVNPANHFWTESNAVTRFSVSYGGVERTMCEAARRDAGQQRCEFFLPGSAAESDVAEYLYLAYTPDRLVVLNQTDDQWMALAGTVFYNYNPNIMVQGAEIRSGDPNLYQVLNPAAVIDQLAPGQCLLFTNGDPAVDAPPQPCVPIARLDVHPDLIFWAADFELTGTTDDQRRTCPAAVPDQLTLCIMPR